MAVPYSNSIAQALDGHLRIKESNDWKYVEDVQVKDGGSWRDVKEVWVRHSGSWRLVHEGEHFLFDITLGSNSNTQWSLSSYISGQGYSGNIYDLRTASQEGIIYPSLDPSIFELKFPNNDIEGKVVGDR